MSWIEVKKAFFVDGKWIDIGVCANCNCIHIPPEEANACGSGLDSLDYKQLKKKYDDLRRSKS